MTEHNPDRKVLWPGYFNAKVSRRSGRRVPKEAAVVDPTLDGLAWAARQAGLTRLKREADISHPKRPGAKEGRLWISTRDANSNLGTKSKEAIMQSIGRTWRSSQREQKDAERAAKAAGPKAGDKRAHAQRKQVKVKGSKGKKKRKKWKI